MQYIKAAQVLLTMWRFHIQSMERWTSDKWAVVLITDNNRQLPSTTDNYRQQADNYRQQADNYRRQAHNYRQQAEKYQQQANTCFH